MEDITRERKTHKYKISRLHHNICSLFSSYATQETWIMYIFCSIAHNHFFSSISFSPSLQHCHFFRWFMVHWWCVVCIVHFQRSTSCSKCIIYRHIHFAAVAAHTHRSHAEWFVHSTPPYEAIVCRPQMCIRRTGNDSFLGSFQLQHRGWMISMVYVLCSFDALPLSGAYTFFVLSLVRSFVRSVVYTSYYSVHAYRIDSIPWQWQQNHQANQTRLYCRSDQLHFITLLLRCAFDLWSKFQCFLCTREPLKSIQIQIMFISIWSIENKLFWIFTVFCIQSKSWAHWIFSVLSFKNINQLNRTKTIRVHQLKSFKIS